MHAGCFLSAVVTALLSGIVAPSAAAQMTAAFGPKQYDRVAGPVQTFAETFSHCGIGQQCQIVVSNGNADGSNRIANASISLNGVQMFGPNDFSQQPVRMVRPVALVDRNQLTITLTSQPGTFFTVEVECATSSVIFSASSPSDSVRNGMLLTALPIINTGTTAAQNVTATAIALRGGTLISPSVPFQLGTIAAGASTVLNAEFSGTFNPRANEILTVTGAYSAGAATYCFTLSSRFTVLPAALGSANVGVTTVTPNSVTGGRFPHQPLNFPDTVNTSRWTVPTVGATTFQTYPRGLRVSVDGGAPLAAPFGLTLSSGTHIITAATTQAGPEGTRYVFRGWSDGGRASHQISVVAVPATYTANFVKEYLLTTSVLPVDGGSILVMPAPSEPGAYYELGTKVIVTARSNPSYLFAGFGGALLGTTNPQTITMTAPLSVVANFTAR